LVGCAAISFGARGHGGDRRSGKWRRTENNAIWVDQHELEELAEANEARDESTKASVRLDGSQDDSEVVPFPPPNR
jgi:hypothetical protein